MTDYRNKKLDHFTLDYRIICTKHALPGKSDYVTSFDYSEKKHMKPLFANKISDVCTVANNLGFEQGKIVFPEDYGQKGIVYMKDNKTILFEFRSHANGNVHLKFNKEFMKALNVEVARELNWIKTPEEIKEEFCDEFADEAEKYFNKTVQFKLTEVPKLILGE